MNRVLFTNIILFFVLILAQVLLFNKMSIYGFTPYIYILFILLYPVKYNPIGLVFLSFLLGLSMDVFLNSGGIHASACLVIAYLRPSILKFSFGTSYEFHHIKFAYTDFAQRTTYFAILILIHHLVLFLLEAGNMSFIGYTLKQTLFTSLYTLLISLVLVFLFSKKKR